MRSKIGDEKEYKYEKVFLRGMNQKRESLILENGSEISISIEKGLKINYEVTNITGQGKDAKAYGIKRIKDFKGQESFIYQLTATTMNRSYWEELIQVYESLSSESTHYIAKITNNHFILEINEYLQAENNSYYKKYYYTKKNWKTGWIDFDFYRFTGLEGETLEEILIKTVVRRDLSFTLPVLPSILMLLLLPLFALFLGMGLAKVYETYGKKREAVLL